MAIVEKISCAHCGAPLPFEPGEIFATCRYCGFTVVVETGKAFIFEHSMFVNRFDPAKIEEPVKAWMSSGFVKPPDLAKKSKITEKSLVYLPFWIISVEAKSHFKGIFERGAPATIREGTIEKRTIGSF